MNSDNKNKIGARRKSSFSRIDKIHPVKMMLYLALAGIIYLVNGYVYYTGSLINMSVLIVDVVFATAMLAIGVIAF